AGLQPIFIPRTLYELIYLNQLLRQERETAFDQWLLKPLPRWETLEAVGVDHASPSVSLQPTTVALAHPFLGKFRDELASKFREEAQVGMKIYLLDYVFYNRNMVDKCTWVAHDFKQSMLGALDSMSVYLATKIQNQVNTSANYN
ncbi:MAG TPA: hypothetical protein VHM70_22085, partial [Polyangiaceae bacterium]|nr:hypothetical protein [Polyangiaceae bacterium]